MRTIHSFKPGELFHERYRLKKIIGVGGFAEVWLVDDTLVDKETAIKIYAQLDSDGTEQLKKEYANVEAFSHPNILKAEHFAICNKRPYLKMKYCAGGNLSTHIGTFTATDMLYVVRDIMSALAYLHENNIVHQDIKPANILIDTSSSRANFVLCDFGISSRTRTSMSRSMRDLKENMQFMTTFYAPPEKFSARQQDHEPFAEGDIFSFGVTLLELTGALNGIDTSLGQEMMYKNVRNVDLSSLPSEPLRLMVARMLRFDRKERGTAKLYLDWAKNIIEKLGSSEITNIKTVGNLEGEQERYMERLAENMGLKPVISGKVKVVTSGGDDLNGEAEINKPKEEESQSNIYHDDVMVDVDDDSLEVIEADFEEEANDNDDPRTQFNNPKGEYEEDEDDLVLELEPDEEPASEQEVLIEQRKEADKSGANKVKKVDIVSSFNDGATVVNDSDNSFNRASYYPDNGTQYGLRNPYNGFSDNDNKTKDIKSVSRHAPGKKGLWLVLVLSALLAGAITFGVIYMVRDQSDSSTVVTEETTQDDEIYIPTTEVTSMETEVNTLKEAVDGFSKTVFKSQKKFNNDRYNIVNDIRKQIDKIRTYGDSKTSSNGEKKQLNDMLERLRKLQERMDGFTYLSGSTPIGG